MSGGFFNYQQNRIEDIANEIEEIILEAEGNNECGYSLKTIEELKEGVKALRRAYTYAKRIDWLHSGDDGEETFHEKLNKELRDE